MSLTRLRSEHVGFEMFLLSCKAINLLITVLFRGTKDNNMPIYFAYSKITRRMLVTFWEYSNKDGQLASQNLYRMLNGLVQVELYLFWDSPIKSNIPKSTYHLKAVVFPLLFQNTLNFILDSYQKLRKNCTFKHFIFERWVQTQNNWVKLRRRWLT